MSTIVTRSAQTVAPPRLSLGAMALCVASLMAALHLISGNSLLTDGGGDNDSLMRLVEVRDLLAGQDWFDLSQHRMGPAGGILMHWSRLVDAPIAALILAGSALSGSQATGETIALVLWPLLLSFAALYLIVRLSRVLAGEAAVLPAMLVGALVLYFVPTFLPGAIDHHNVQLVLMLGAICLLAEADASPARAGAAGALAALMLAIGMESVPYVAAAGLWCAGLFLVRGERHGPFAFGAGFAAAAGAAFLATVPASRWASVACDAYSLPQLGIALICGAGLALVTAAGGRSMARRAAGLAGVAVAAAVVLIGLFPQCLNDPYATVDPRLHTYWLDSITETLPFWIILESRPKMAFTYYVTPMIALVWLGATIRRHGPRRIHVLVGVFLAVAFLVSLWQVRGAMFALPFAVVPLAAWIAGARTAAAIGGTGAALKMVAVWLVSINAVWAAGANYVASVVGEAAQDRATRMAGACYSEADYAALAVQPATNVLAVSNLGAAILRFTHHHAISGSYHRNFGGNIIALDAFMGDGQGARKVIEDNAVGLVAHCPGNDESKALADWAPGGFMADLQAGRVPDWLEEAGPSTTGPLRLYRVRN